LKKSVIPFACLLVLAGCKKESVNQLENQQVSASEKQNTPIPKKFGGEYEGYITITTKNGVVKLLPIWASLKKSETSDSVTGAYFYRKVGKEISLNGILSSDSLEVTETSSGKVTGIFSGTDYKDSVVGEWKAGSGKKGNPFVLYPAKPENRQYAIFATEKLIVTEHIDGTMSLKSVLAPSADYKETGMGESEGTLEYLFSRNNIMSALAYKSYMGAYPLEGTLRFIFDLKSGRQLVVKKEIDPAKMSQFETLLKSKIQNALIEEKKVADPNDADFISAISGNIENIDNLSNQQVIDQAFTVGDISGFNDFYIDGKGLNLSISGFFGLPHVVQCYDIYLDVVVPFSELKTFLKQNSPLMNVTM